jgi:Fe2+ transport system protein FeoA
MSSITLAFGSKPGRGGNRRPDAPDDRDRFVPRSDAVGPTHVAIASNGVKTLAELPVGARGVVVEVGASNGARADRLLSLGVTPGARVSVLQTFPGVVFLCDQTELAVERSVARSVMVRLRQSSVATLESPAAPTDDW